MMQSSLHMCVYVYMYIYICRERERRYMMQRAHSLEETLVLGKIEDKGTRG